MRYVMRDDGRNGKKSKLTTSTRTRRMTMNSYALKMSGLTMKPWTMIRTMRTSRMRRKLRMTTIFL
jgi:hypothetical protein